MEAAVQRSRLTQAPSTSTLLSDVSAASSVEDIPRGITSKMVTSTPAPRKFDFGEIRKGMAERSHFEKSVDPGWGDVSAGHWGRAILRDRAARIKAEGVGHVNFADLNPGPAGGTAATTTTTKTAKKLQDLQAVSDDFYKFAQPKPKAAAAMTQAFADNKIKMQDLEAALKYAQPQPIASKFAKAQTPMTDKSMQKAMKQFRWNEGLDTMRDGSIPGVKYGRHPDVSEGYAKLLDEAATYRVPGVRPDNSRKKYPLYGDFVSFMQQPGGWKGKAKYLAKKAAWQAFKTIAVAAPVGAVSGSISSAMNKKVYDENSERSKGVMGQLKSLKDQLVTSKVNLGKRYSSLLPDLSNPGTSYDSVAAAVATGEPESKRKKVNKQAVAPIKPYYPPANRFAQSDW
jgi:hypothetical protein